MLCYATLRYEHVLTLLGLALQVKDLEEMEWNMTTDVNAVFRLILKRACKAKVPQHQMIKTLFIFSDMQFNEACSGGAAWGYARRDCRSHILVEGMCANFEAAKADFERAGYKLPRVVFWNLRGYGGGEDASIPVTQREDGTALVSGFSGQLLKLFMDEGVEGLESFNPFNIMKEAIGKEKYNGWQVVD